MSRSLKKTLICLFVGAFSTWLFGETKSVVLQNGLNEYKGTKDSYMSSNMGTPSTDPKGTKTKLTTYEWFAWGNAFARVAISFELPEAISGTTIKSAKLSIYFEGGTAADISTVFRLTQDWVEDELTWANTGSSETWIIPWDTPQNPMVVGNDFPPSGMIEVNDSAKAVTSAVGNAWEEYDVTELIQIFSDGTPNYGFFIRNDDKGGNTNRAYYSSEYEDDISLRPKLEIAYETSESSISNFNDLGSFNSVYKIETLSEISYSLNFNKMYEISLFSLNGKLIKNFKGIGQNQFIVDKMKLSSSTYILMLKRDGLSKISERLMIMK